MDLCLLGPLELRGPTGVVTFRGPMERVLLALLAVRAGRVVSMTELLTGLWGEEPPPTALKTAHGHVARLRRSLERGGLPGIVETRDPGYVLALAPEQLDLARFETIARRGRELAGLGKPARALDAFDDALGLWRGDAFVDVRERSEVLAAEAVRLDELRLTTVEARADALLAVGRHEEVVADLEVLVAQHPLRERLWASLMVALYRCRRQADALRAYQRARDALVEALGVDPGPELAQLEIAVLEQDPRLDLPELAATASAAGAEVSRLVGWSRSGPTFVGRTAEREQLERRLADASDGAPSLVLVRGDAGIGKTRLAAEVGVVAESHGMHTLYGRCDDGLSVPFQPFVEALRADADATVGSLDAVLGRYANELTRLVPELGERLSAPAPLLAADPATEQYRLFDAVTDWLRTSSRRSPVVLVLDDLHWAAPPTLLMLRHLVRAEDLGRVLLVGTYRRDELEQNGTLARLVGDLRGASAVLPVEDVDLDGFDVGETAGFVEAATGSDLDDLGLAGMSLLHEHTGGNPFFLSEIVRSDPGLVARLRAAVTEQPLELDVPAAAREVVARRALRLSASTRRVLTVAAVAGSEFAVPLVTEVIDEPVDLVLDALEEADAAHLVHEVGRDRFAFSHAIVRRAIYDQVTETRRAVLHRRIGAAIERLYATALEPHLPELVHHFAETEPAKAARYAIAGASSALAALAFEDAMRIAEAGLQAVEQARLEGLTVDRTDQCDLLLALGRAELRAGRRRGRVSLLRAYDLARTDRDHLRQAAAVLAINRGYFARMGRVDQEIVATLEDALRAQPDPETPEVAELLAVLASELVWAPDGDRRFALSDRALEIARSLGDARTLARVLLLRGMTILTPDNLDVRAAESRELLAAAESLGDPSLLFDAEFANSGTTWEASDPEGANRAQETALALAHELREPRLIWQASFMTTSRLISEGRLAEGEEYAHRTLELGRQANQDGEALIFFTEQLLEVRRWQDRLGEVLELFRDFAGEPSIDFGFSLTRYLAEAGEDDAARRVYERLRDEVPLPPRRDMLALPTVHSLTTLAVRYGDHDHAAALAECLRPWRGLFAHTTVAKPVGAHFLGLIAAMEGRHDEAIEHFAFALDKHRAIGSPLIAAETQLEWARSCCALGDLETARQLAADARDTGLRLGAALLVRRVGDLAGVE